MRYVTHEVISGDMTQSVTDVQGHGHAGTLSIWLSRFQEK